MSAKTRFLWILPAVVVASWLAVRSLAALPADALDDPPLPSVTSTAPVSDPLAQLISRFGDEARAPR
jgi:hypothetical protein